MPFTVYFWIQRSDGRCLVIWTWTAWCWQLHIPLYRLVLCVLYHSLFIHYVFKFLWWKVLSLPSAFVVYWNLIQVGKCWMGIWNSTTKGTCTNLQCSSSSVAEALSWTGLYASPVPVVSYTRQSITMCLMLYFTGLSGASGGFSTIMASNQFTASWFRYDRFPSWNRNVLSSFLQEERKTINFQKSFKSYNAY